MKINRNRRARIAGAFGLGEPVELGVLVGRVLREPVFWQIEKLVDFDLRNRMTEELLHPVAQLCLVLPIQIERLEMP